MSETTAIRPHEPRAEAAKEVRCPRCKALLFKSSAEGEIETKCRKCSKIVTLHLKR